MFRRGKKKDEELEKEALEVLSRLEEEEVRKKEVEEWWRQETPPEDDVELDEDESETKVDDDDLLLKLKEEVESVKETNPLLEELEDVNIHELLVLATDVRETLEEELVEERVEK